jgi:tetratricopeptide (TPR) repeat protein
MDLNSIKSKSKPKAVINLREKASVELQSTTKSNISKKSHTVVKSKVIELNRLSTSETKSKSNSSLIQHNNKLTKKSSSKSESQIVKVTPNSRILSNSQWVLVLYNIIFFAVLSAIIILDWSSVWQLPKAVTFILGVTGFLILASIFWIFGLIKHSVAITLGDILFTIAGISAATITFLNPNRIAFWGSTSRIFDAGVFIVFLILFYIILKLLLEQKALIIFSFFTSVLILLASSVAVISVYIPNFLSSLSILNQLQPTSSWLTESPQELVFLNLISVNLIFLILTKIKAKTFINIIINGIYSFSVFIQILLLIRLPNSSIYYVLTILTIISHTITYIQSISQKSNVKLISTRVSVFSGIIMIFLVYSMILSPFKDNARFQEYVVLANPSMELSVNIMKQSLQSDTWFGSSNIMYAWDRFNPESVDSQLPNFSFETLFNEITNIVVKNGIVVSSLLFLFALWILLSVLRIILIQKTIPTEILPLALIIVGLFSIPFTVITKFICIIILLLWSNIFTKYFKPILKFSLDINKIPSSISSLFTFTILLSISLAILASSKMYNIIKSQEYIVKAAQTQNNLSEQVKLLSQAQNKSPYIIDYANFYMQAFIKQINEQALELFNISNDNNVSTNTDVEKQKTVQDNIMKAQELIDEYKAKFALDSRVIYWQLELYSIMHKYSEVEENVYLSNISRGRELKPKSQDWDIYEAQYYARQAQKGQELDSEQLEKAKSILNDSIAKNQFSVEAYKNYYELLSFTDSYEEQINILEKYIQILSEKSIPADQELVYLLGLAYQNNSQYTEAITVYNKLLETFPEYTNVYFKLGEIYEEQDNLDLAKQNYQKVLDLDPNAEAASLKLEQLQ